MENTGNTDLWVQSSRRGASELMDGSSRQG